MKIHKLSATSSTNLYLKNLVLNSKPDNYTIVVTEYQTLGKGQFENKWHSEKGKNLLFSVLYKFDAFKITRQAYLNFAISLAIYKVLDAYLPKANIKWPNDILSRQKKIGGILIENSVKNGRVNHSIIGIGVNVNQIKFPLELPNATSLKKVLKKSFNRSKLLEEFVVSIQKQLALIESKSFEELKFNYEKVLYKNKIPAMYKDLDGNPFIGKIIGVSNIGKLQIELENETIREFSVKEVSFL